MKEQQDKKEFREKKKSLSTLNYLKSQSTQNYSLYKDEQTGLYYIRRVKDKKTILIGDKDQSEHFILDGLWLNKDEVKELFAPKKEETN